jgi:uncharacterized membrane protein YfcA
LLLRLLRRLVLLGTPLVLEILEIWHPIPSGTESTFEVIVNNADWWLTLHILQLPLFGLFIGLISSLLGVAGGELILPTLVFGAGIKTADTASLLISLPTVAVGVLRHRRLSSFTERGDLTQTVAPMGLGSVVGAVAGGLFVGVVPATALKFVLGMILIVSAVRIFRGS